MSTKAEIWLNANNDADQFRIPVNPEALKLTYKGITTSIKLDHFGEVLHKGMRDAAVISFASYFPAHGGAFCAYDGFPDPLSCHDRIIQRMESNLPVHFVYSGEGRTKAFDLYAYITSYTPSEVGGDPGTLQYTIELKELRSSTLKVIRNGKVFTTSTRPGNIKDKTKWQVRAKETLYSIAKVCGRKNPKGYKKKIISKNKGILSKWKKQYNNASKAKRKKNFIKDGKYVLKINGSLTLP